MMSICFCLDSEANRTTFRRLIDIVLSTVATARLLLPDSGAILSQASQIFSSGKPISSIEMKGIALCKCGRPDEGDVTRRAIHFYHAHSVPDVYRFLQKILDPLYLLLMMISLLLPTSFSFAQTGAASTSHQLPPGIGRQVRREESGLRLLNAAITSLNRGGLGTGGQSIELIGHCSFVRTGGESSFIWRYDANRKPVQPWAELEVDGSRVHKAESKMDPIDKGTSEHFFSDVTLASPDQYFTRIAKDPTISIQYRGKVEVGGETFELLEISDPKGPMQMPPLKQRWFLDESTRRPRRVEMDVYGAIVPSITTTKRYEFSDFMESGYVTFYQTIKLYYQNNLFAIYHIDSVDTQSQAVSGGLR